MLDSTVDLWATDEVHFQQHESRCRMSILPEIKDPILFHAPTRKSVGYFGAVRLRDGKFLCRRDRAALSPTGLRGNSTLRNLRWTFCHHTVLNCTPSSVSGKTRRLCLHNRYFEALDVIAAVEGQFKPPDRCQRHPAATMRN